MKEISTPIVELWTCLNAKARRRLPQVCADRPQLTEIPACMYVCASVYHGRMCIYACAWCVVYIGCVW